MNTQVNSPAIVPPTSYYSHAIEVPNNARTLFISGLISAAPDGTCADDFATQAKQCWINLGEVLTTAGMNMGDLVRVQAFITRPSDLAEYRSIRNEMVGSHRPAHTLLVVAALGRPEWLVEIEAIAAKA